MAGTCTQRLDDIRAEGFVNIRKVTMLFTADASTGSYPSTDLDSATVNKLTGWFCHSLEVIPGATAPTSGFAVGVTDADGCKVLGGALTSITVPANGYPLAPLNNSLPYPAAVTSKWTVAPTGNSVNSATFTLIFNFMR